jgi:hypothetical protein
MSLSSLDSKSSIFFFATFDSRFCSNIDLERRYRRFRSDGIRPASQDGSSTSRATTNEISRIRKRSWNESERKWLERWVEIHGDEYLERNAV